jgi:TMEM175 potassium channel family protein
MGEKARKAQLTDETGLERLIFFSDAVFAIAITLLALDVRLPDLPEGASDDSILRALLQIGPQYFGYVVSFAVIGLIWMGHHRMFRSIGSYDRMLMLLALLQLMIVAFLPFPTRLIGEFGTSSRVVTIFYSLVLICCGLTTAFLGLYVLTHRWLLKEGAEMPQARQALGELLLMPALFAASALVALWSVDLAWLIWWGILALSIVQIFMNWRQGKR